ncbi:protein transport protein Sec61 subunit gamma isoform X1 [Physeter macrocephalus]|uniref:Protein transport protein Sec61 subunit gamma n=1 Tax=Physeter macrocephalus TaxID=9755 RepID=A0A455BAS7_PHYMC|nr:protein transport protein Sec61 subunit gamma isoform X1 [Physeter catodon]|eukprot:XP_028346075.1 protein transport protein Sec61 subunit gamma isoform X1 [Physeter catodon]
MDQVMQFVEPSRQFVKDSIRLVKRCTKPDRKEFQKIAMATAIGFAIMGFIGFFVKLIHIPINNIIVSPVLRPTECPAVELNPDTVSSSLRSHLVKASVPRDCPTSDADCKCGPQMTPTSDSWLQIGGFCNRPQVQ